MAHSLLWLKWRLGVNGVKHDRQRAIGLPLLAVTLALLGWWAVSRYVSVATKLPAEAATEYSLWFMTIGFFLWVTLPVLLFPVDEPIDPAKLMLLPMSRVKMMSGLTGAGLITFTVVVPLLVLGGNFVVFSSPAGIVAGVLAGTIMLLLLVVAGQAFTAFVSLGLRNRRGRDLAFLLVSLIGLTGYALQQQISRTVEELGIDAAVQQYGISPVAWLFPPSATQYAVAAADSGDVGVAAGYLLVALGWLVVLVWVWNRLLDHLITTPGYSGLPQTSARKDFAARPALWSPEGVLIRKELRLFLRDPRMRMVWTGGAVFLGILAASVLVGSTSVELFRRLPWLTLTGPAIVLFVGLPISLNQLGWERNAASFLLALPAHPRSILVGKNVASAVGLAIEAAVMSIALAAISGGWEWLPLVVPLTLVAIESQLAVGNLVSVLAPLRLPPLGTDVFAQATEQGCLAIVFQAVSFFVMGLTLVPVVVAFVLVVAGELNAVAASIGSIAWGAGIYWVALVTATRLLSRRIPEVVAAVETR